MVCTPSGVCADGFSLFMLPALCPCGRADARGRPFAFDACCGRFLDAGDPAPDAESLMRSRYSAFVLERVAYLRESWHASTRPADLALEPGLAGRDQRDFGHGEQAVQQDQRQQYGYFHQGARPVRAGIEKSEHTIRM